MVKLHRTTPVFTEVYLYHVALVVEQLQKNAVLYVQSLYAFHRRLNP